MSHPSRVRELKLYRFYTDIDEAKSHPSRVRELKLRVAGTACGGRLVAPLAGA